MHTRRRRWFVLALFPLLTAVFSWGQETPRPDAQARPGARARGRDIAFPLSQALDANRDGQLSAEEIEASTEALKKLDANRDGKLSAEEIGWPPRGFGGPGGGPPPFGGPPGELGRTRPGLARRVMSRDANADGKVTSEELAKSMRFLVRLAEANGDGAIDAKEAERLSPQLGMDSPPSATPKPDQEKPVPQRGIP